jgi:hypothetical protein
MNARTAVLPDLNDAFSSSASVCPACGTSGTDDFFSVDRLPVHVGIFYDTPVQALQAPTGDVTLVYCGRCGFVHNRRFDPGLIHYRPGYEVGLQFSPTFLQFIQEVADRLRTRTEVASPFARLRVRPGAASLLPIDELAPMMMLPVGLALRSPN